MSTITPNFGLTLPGVNDPTDADQWGTQLNGDLTIIDTLVAPLASPTFTGVPAGPTAAPGTNTTQFATTEFVQTAVTGAPPAQGSVIASRSGLVVRTTGLSANITVTANELTVENTSSTYLTGRALSLTVNTASSGANGLDTGTVAASTWYALWVISDGTNYAGLISLSSTAPTMPGSYTYKARIGWVRTDASANKYPLGFTQRDNRIQYKVAFGSNVPNLPLAASGNAGNVNTPIWATLSLINYVPITASTVQMQIYASNGGSILVAPNNEYGPDNSLTNPPPLAAHVQYGGQWETKQGFLLFETAQTLWYAAGVTGNALISIIGWEDNL